MTRNIIGTVTVLAVVAAGTTSCGSGRTHTPLTGSGWDQMAKERG